MEGICVSKQERCISNQYTMEKEELMAQFFMDIKGLRYSPNAVRCGNAECFWNPCAYMILEKQPQGTSSWTVCVTRRGT